MSKKNDLYETFHNSSKSSLRYIQRSNFTYRNILRITEEYIGKSKNVLDIGCGVGEVDLYLRNKNNINIIGIDISKKAIEAAKQSAKKRGLKKNIQFYHMNFPKKFPNKKFDLVLCFEVIEHLKNDDLAFKVMYSLVNKGGYVIISTPSLNAPMHRMGLAKDFDKRVGHIRRYKEDNLRKLALRNGFRVKEIRMSEGIVRNFLFLNPVAGKLVRFVKFFIVDIVSSLDYLSMKAFGESNIFIVLQKPS